MSIADADEMKSDKAEDKAESAYSESQVSGETGGTESSSATLSRSRRPKGFIDKCLAAIPFTLLVALLMAIPIGFLIIYSILEFVEASHTLNYMNAHQEFVPLLGTCGHHIIDERVSTLNVIINNNTEHWLDLLEERTHTDMYCGLVVDLAAKSPDPVISEEWSREMRKALAEVEVLRNIAPQLGTVQTTYRYTDVIMTLDSARAKLAKNEYMKGGTLPMLQLQLVWNIGLMIVSNRGCGAEIITLGDTVPMALITMFSKYRGDYWEYRSQLEGLATGPAKEFLDTFDADPNAVQAIIMMESLYQNIWLDETWVTYDEWIAAFTAAFNAAPETEAKFVAEIESMASKAMASEAGKLSGALIACVFAAGLILRSNVMTQAKIDKAIKKSKTMQAAVQKFVPRSFLKMCGTTSILHVNAGDATQVATGMVYTTIRNFAAVSENMSNRELFDWLQSYLKRMTQLAEENNGFIDKFVGDAIWAVFTSATDAVQCTIDMHTAVGELNLRFVSKRGKHLIEIGAGVHYAVVNAGFLGDESRLTVTLISVEVSTAQRLEAMARKYGAKIIVSHPAVEQVPDPGQFDWRYLGEAQAKSCMKPFGVTEVYQADSLAVKNFKTESKSTFEEAVAARLRGKLAHSNVLFERCRTMASAVDMEDEAVNFKLSHEMERDEFEEL